MGLMDAFRRLFARWYHWFYSAVIFVYGLNTLKAAWNLQWFWLLFHGFFLAFFLWQYSDINRHVTAQKETAELERKFEE